MVALVEVDGQGREMIFLTNHLEWSAQTVADLYRCRWAMEVFFKQIKQTLQLADFLGNSANAVQWQIWTALLTYVRLRFCAWLGQWAHSFTRLFALLRSALWQKLELRSLLEVYGTAGGGGRFLEAMVTSPTPLALQVQLPGGARLEIQAASQVPLAAALVHALAKSC